MTVLGPDSAHGAFVGGSLVQSQSEMVRRSHRGSCARPLETAGTSTGLVVDWKSLNTNN